MTRSVVWGVLVLLSCQPIAFAASRPTSDPIAVVLSLDRGAQSGEIVAFDGVNGRVVKRLPIPYWSARQSVDMLLNRAGTRLYLARFLINRNGHLRNTLSLMDTRSWRTLASVTVSHRVMYHYFSPQGMALSPDGSRLFVYNYITTNPYQTPNDWLTVLNATTLRRQSVRIKLPGCDAEQMTTTHDRIVVLCYGSEDLRFVDPNTETVVRRVLLPFSGSSMVGSADGGRIFVAGDTGEFTSIGTKRGGFTRTLNYQPQFGAPVGPVQAAVSGNGRYLFVGIARATSGTALYTNVIQLPSLKLRATLKMPPSLELASAPSGFYAYPKATTGFPVGSSSVIQRVAVTTRGANATSLLSLPGQIYFFATPISSPPGR